MTTAGSARRKKRVDLAFVATCGAGLEQLVAAEISAAGGKNPVITPGAVAWEGNLETGYRLCLWSRFASRVLLQIGQFDAPDQEALYQQAGRIDWDDHFTPRRTFAVFSTLTEAPISHSKFAALRVKDAIADQFRARAGRRPFVDTETPDIRINLHMHGNLATLALDLSGESLHRRGYRLSGTEAPLKETLAAAIVQLAGFSREFPAAGVLLDPMCGSGTLLIEAALLYGDSAPGLQRKSFGFHAWNRHDERLWERLVAEALAREEEALSQTWPRFIGYDADPRAVGAARENVRAAGLTDRIQISQRQLAMLDRPAESGMLLVNPPYGERLADTENIKYLYRCLGRKIGQELAGWQIGFFASNSDLADSLGIAWSDTFRLYNGPIKCKLHRGVARQKEQAPRPLPAIQTPKQDEREGLDFANRLYKNCAALFPWAAREGVSCCRLYDADLPDFNLTVDLYDGLVLVREYAAAKVDELKAQHRFHLAVQAVREVLQLPRSALYLNRRRPRDSKQGKGPVPKGRLLEVMEGGCRFLVSLPGDASTGLDLAQRTIRRTIGALAQGRTFLNLFGGSGAATVHALAGGIHTSTLVDPSATALLRARANFALNGFGGPQHATVEADCLPWLEKCRPRYSLILVNPPSASRDRTNKFTFDLQADHARLLHLAMQRLARQGQLLFIAASRKFSLDPTLTQEFVVREITDEIMAEDFRHGRRPLRCWELRHPQEESSDLVAK
ncbi:MAG TPA: bifunctional 23S rRNA (guanine(2069)-N(7))-methyltransferase RlmK/23S rRNA (guanine(2445)-N(2))-methyltransferase RlmL [Desulfobulbaceae bacterium]|nr:bifunctional 23S rRNA (guanine(2069)-N(7))-methyltransferase RlmK/23S rRNA (guanine(2445)-N(2))-methyltransferase RlmL [Desulfobulbaceae bacterium]